LESAPDPRVTSTVPIVPFVMDGHRFGLLARDVREVLRAATPSPLPHAPAVVLGLLNVRGELVPVLDVRSRFGLRPRPLVHTDHLVVATAGARTVAFAVEAADVLLEVAPGSLEVARTHGEHVAGVVKLEDGTLVVYDLTTFLSQDEGAQLDTALGAAGP
jgi:purine-binding chemotaxis protein CheW